MVIIEKAKIPLKTSFLVIDDESEVREIIKLQLENLGFQGPFLDASSSEEALNLLSASKVDFILSDWNMAGASGFDFLMALREEKAFKNIPFLMITANDNISGVLAAIKKGASDYLIKPWNEEEFKEKLGYAWLKHHSA